MASSSGLRPDMFSVVALPPLALTPRLRGPSRTGMLLLVHRVRDRLQVPQGHLVFALHHDSLAYRSSTIFPSLSSSCHMRSMAVLYLVAGSLCSLGQLRLHDLRG